MKTPIQQLIEKLELRGHKKAVKIAKDMLHVEKEHLEMAFQSTSYSFKDVYEKSPIIEILLDNLENVEVVEDVVKNKCIKYKNDKISKFIIHFSKNIKTYFGCYKNFQSNRDIISEFWDVSHTSTIINDVDCLYAITHVYYLYPNPKTVGIKSSVNVSRRQLYRGESFEIVDFCKEYKLVVLKVIDCSDDDFLYFYDGDIDLSCQDFTELPQALKYFKEIKGTLFLTGCENLTSLKGLENLTSVKFLNLNNCTKLEDVSSLKNLVSYKNIYFEDTSLNILSFFSFIKKPKEYK